ncbi:MAG: hypothetical protein LBV17_12410 [Treponema sp.]|jgi:hypothetical protein|nr:hypothetical protein [Treponema sp.]
MINKGTREIINLLKIYILPIIIALFIIFGIKILITLILWPPDIYFKLKFEMQIKMDKRIKKLLHFKLNPGPWNANFNIGIELKDGNKITYDVIGSIYDSQRIIKVNEYKIELLTLSIANENNKNKFNSHNFISYHEGIDVYLLTNILNQENGYFYNLNNILDYLDEFKLLLDTIYNEELIPGDINYVGSDITKWGDDEELERFTGYFETVRPPDNVWEKIKVKIYVINK